MGELPVESGHDCSEYRMARRLGTCPKGVTTGCDSTTNTSQRRVISLLNPALGKYFGPVDQFDSSGTASYNALILLAHHTLSKNVSVDANYTWSHCIGDATQASTVGGAQAGLLEPNDRRFDRGNCQTGTLGGTFGLDRRQIVNLTAVAQSPTFSNRALAGGRDWMDPRGKLARQFRRLPHPDLLHRYSVKRNRRPAAEPDSRQSVMPQSRTLLLDQSAGLCATGLWHARRLGPVQRSRSRLLGNRHVAVARFQDSRAHELPTPRRCVQSHQQLPRGRSVGPDHIGRQRGYHYGE